MQRGKRALQECGATFRIHVRRYFQTAHGGERPHSRQRVVLDARFRMAGAAQCFRTLARAIELRRRRSSEDPARGPAERLVKQDHVLYVLAMLMSAGFGNLAPLGLIFFGILSLPAVAAA